MSRHSFVITFVRLKPLGLRIYHGICNSIQHLLTVTPVATTTSKADPNRPEIINNKVAKVGIRFKYNTS